MKLFENKEEAEKFAEIFNELRDRVYSESIDMLYGLTFKAEFNLEQDKWMVVLEEL